MTDEPNTEIATSKIATPKWRPRPIGQWKWNLEPCEMWLVKLVCIMCIILHSMYALTIALPIGETNEALKFLFIRGPLNAGVWGSVFLLLMHTGLLQAYASDDGEYIFCFAPTPIEDEENENRNG